MTPVFLAQHEAIKSEIEAREDSFRAIVETGEALAQGGHSQAQVFNQVVVPFEIS